MAVKRITVSVEAHRNLTKQKRKGESLSDVINRVLGSTPTLELAGILTPLQGDAISLEVKRLRRDLDQKARRRQSQRRQ